MAKDPAFLFYPGDWMGGTALFSRSHKGAYMDLLMAQFNHGRMSIQDVQDVLGSDFDSMWDRKLKSKFKQDGKGLFYNERLDLEQQKRKNFSQSRRNNLKSNTETSSHTGTHTDTRMENENENKDEDKSLTVIETILERKIRFIETSTNLILTNDIASLNDFFDYWTEANPQGKKMRFEMQKVFDVKRRFATWQKNNKNWNNGKQTVTNERQQRITEVSDLHNLSANVLEGLAAKNRNGSVQG